MDADDTHPELPWQLRLGRIHVDSKPTLVGLYRDASGTERGRLVAWVVALPGGDAVVLPVDGPDKRPVLTTLRGVRRRWARLLGATLVQVAGREALHLAG
jgi:hypothetical protein